MWRPARSTRKPGGKIEKMETPSFEEFAKFIRQWAKLSRKERIVPETEFEYDLGITGDDGCDLLEATEQRFRVALSSREHGYRNTFNLGPNEVLFHAEGFGPDLLTIFGRSAPVVVSFTVDKLYNAVRAAMSDKAAPSYQ